MSTKKSTFVCSDCGYETLKWLGRCPGCGSWNSFAEIRPRLPDRTGRRENPAAGPLALSSIPPAAERRFLTGMGEFDRVLGGGAVSGSVILLGGDPGIGKSTLLLQAAAAFSCSHSVLYASGEESLSQIKCRAERLRVDRDINVLAATDLEVLQQAVEEIKPQVVIVDSVQSFYSREVEGVPGSINQVREVTATLVRLAKERDIIVFLLGHVTKEGIMAGPRLLEHMVDCVLYLEGDRYHTFRILRGVKNRFGSTNEIGVFVMEDTGLTEVVNPSYFFISGGPRQAAGAVVTASLEGTRPLLVEIQSLVAASSYASPRRTASGIDVNRLALILAVLEKHARISFAGLDTFVNVVGGVRLVETAVDLALAVSLVSSLKEKSFSPETVVIGEVGLTGEIRPVSRIGARLQEGSKLGFTRFIVPAANLEECKKTPHPLPTVTGVENIEEAIALSLLG